MTQVTFSTHCFATIRFQSPFRTAMKPLLLLIITGLLLSSSLTAAAEPGELLHYDWIEMRSEHFRVFSARDRKRTRELIVELEHFRQAVGILSNANREERVPTILALLPIKVPEWQALQGETADGFFVPGMLRNFAVMFPNRRDQNQDREAALIKHEFVHFLVSNHGGEYYFPLWLSEGFADFLSTVKVEGMVVEYGRFSKDLRALLEFTKDITRGRKAVAGEHVKTRPWLSFTQVLNARSYQDLGKGSLAIFYAQAKLLTHFLMLGLNDNRYAVQQQRFLRLLDEGKIPTEAFQKVWNISPSKLNKRLRAYLDDVQFMRIRLRQPFPEPQIRVRVLPKDEVAVALGQGAWQLGRGALAERSFLAALNINPDNTDALNGIGWIHTEAGRDGQAEAAIERAIALDPDDAQHYHSHAGYLLHQIGRAEDPKRQQALLSRARAQLARAYKLDSDNPGILYTNGISYLREDERGIPTSDTPDKALASLEVAHSMLPGNTSIRLGLAQAYIAASQPLKAIPLLRACLAYPHVSDETFTYVKRMLKQIGTAAGSR